MHVWIFSKCDWYIAIYLFFVTNACVGVCLCCYLCCVLLFALIVAKHVTVWFDCLFVCIHVFYWLHGYVFFLCVDMIATRIVCCSRDCSHIVLSRFVAQSLKCINLWNDVSQTSGTHASMIVQPIHAHIHECMHAPLNYSKYKCMFLNVGVCFVCCSYRLLSCCVLYTRRTCCHIPHYYLIQIWRCCVYVFGVMCSGCHVNVSVVLCAFNMCCMSVVFSWL